MTLKGQPKYQHDCASCIFLGQTIGGGRTVDLYYHRPNCGAPSGTLVARNSSEGSEYTSCPAELVRPKGHSELWAAKSLFEEAKVSWPAFLTEIEKGKKS